MASIRKRSWLSGREQKTAWIADYFDQGGHRHLKTFTTKRAAETWLLAARSEVAQGIHTPERASITVAEAGQIWIARGERENLERSTLDKYKNHVELHIGPLIGAVKLAQLSAPAVERFRDDLLGCTSRPMARKALGSLKAILSEMQRQGRVAQNVAAAVKIKAKGRDDRKLQVGIDIPAKAEVNAILAAATGRWRPLLITAVFTGMRASELRGLTWDDVDFGEKLIHVRQRADQWGILGSPKSRAGHRSIPMSPMVLSALREWKLGCPRVRVTKEDAGRLWLVFPNGKGSPESHSNIINRGFDPIQVAADVSQPHAFKEDEEGCPVIVAKYGLHAIRHFFASWAIEQGFTPKRLQDLLGHASIQMTYDTYGHLFPTPEDDQARFASGERAIVG